MVLTGILCAAGACRGGNGPAPEARNQLAGQALEGFSLPELGAGEVSWSPEGGLHSGGDAARRPAALVIHVFQPDCLACRQQARELERLNSQHPESAVVGVAYRLDSAAAQEFADETGATYPLLLGSGSDWARRWGRGDCMYVVDRAGSIRYSQVGFHASDPARWQAVLEDLHANRPVRHSGPGRDELVVGETLPPIELPLVGTGIEASLRSSDSGGLVFEHPEGRRRFRAAVGFFSRY